MRIENNILIAECTAYDFKGELERKKLKDWLKSVSAFPNTEGGTIFFGVGNDASIVGIANPQKDMEFISEKINSHLDPIRLKPEKIASKRRNPILAEVFSQLNYMEKRGSGLRKIQDATAILPSYKAEKRPFFESSLEFFYTIIPNVNYGMTEADFEALVDQRQSADEKFTQKVYPETEKFTRKVYPETKSPFQGKIGKTAQAIIDAVVADPKITRKSLAQLLQVSENAIKYHLATLQRREIISHVGPDKGGSWKVLFKK